MKTKARLVLLASLLFVLSLFSLTACNVSGLKINVPEETLNAYVGLYEVPVFEVVNEGGEFMSGYTVKLKSVKNPDGENVEVIDGKINAEKTGVYKFTYKAKGTKDAVLTVNFGYLPPTVDLPKEGLPAFYMSKIWYAVPQFRFGNADVTACKVKLYHESSDKEISTLGGFVAPYSSGNYKWVIDAVSPKGVHKQVEYTIPAIGPTVTVPDKVIYLDEEFGIRQLGFRVPGELELSYNTDAEYKREDEQGSLKVTVAKPGNGTDAGRLILGIPYIADVSEYKSISFWVYNPNDYEITTGYCWGGSTVCAANSWTQIKWDLNAIFYPEGKTHAKFPSIANFQIRFVGADGNSALPVGAEYYLSAIYCLKSDSATEPSVIVPDKVIYLDEEFGISQLGYKVPGELELSYNTDAGYKREDERGSLKVTVAKLGNGGDAGRLILERPYIADVSEYKSISFWVYNPNDYEITAAYVWGGDTVCAAHSWTQVKWDLAPMFTPGKTHAKSPSIANLQIRFVGADKKSALPVGAEYYLSAIYCIK